MAFPLLFSRRSDAIIFFMFFMFTLKNIWAIHTTLYRVCCIEYTLLFVNAQFYIVLCISHSNCIFFFLDLNNLIARNQHYFWKTYEKMCISVSNFYMKIVNNKHTLLYNFPTIHWIQWYNGLCELTNYVLKNPFFFLIQILICS